MDPEDPKIAEFLETVQKDHDEKLRQVCEELIEALPPGGDFQPFNVLTQAEIRLQASKLQELAAMNATPFDSARDEEKQTVSGPERAPSGSPKHSHARRRRAERRIAPKG